MYDIAATAGTAMPTAATANANATTTANANAPNVELSLTALDDHPPYTRWTSGVTLVYTQTEAQQ